MNLRRTLIMAEMHGRDLVRRHGALGLLVALPLSFYLASGRTSHEAAAAGGIGMAFAVAGATLFSALSARDVDERLVLGGFRPAELLMGRLLFLGPLGLVIAAFFSALMAWLSHPQSAWLVTLGVCLVALQSVPFGLAVGALVPRELEGTLVLIGVVGMQMATETHAAVAKALPFYGPRRLIAEGVDGHGSVLGPVLQTSLYGVGLLVLALLVTSPRLTVAARRHDARSGPARDRRIPRPG